MQQLVYQDAAAFITIEKRTNTVIVSWKNSPINNEFKDVLNAGLEIVKEHKIKKWIGDCTYLGAVGQEDQQWSNNEWFPQIISLGVAKMGVIVSDDVFNQLSVEDIMNKVEGADLVSKYFSNVDDAVDWMN